MKKRLLLITLVLALCLAGCSAAQETSDPGSTPASTPNSTPSNNTNIWDGISADTMELPITGRDMTVSLNKDGSASTYAIRSAYLPAAEYGDAFKEFDAEMAVLSCYYGTYKVEGENIVLTLNDQVYSRFAFRGKDLDAFREAYRSYREAESPSDYETIKDAFDKGYTGSASSGTLTMSCVFGRETMKLLGIKTHDTSGVLLNDSVMHEDGTYTNTIYYPDGNVLEVREYNAEDDCTKKTKYHTDGSVEYIEETVRGENLTTTTRTDADGNVLSLHENIKEVYEGGKRTIQRRTENGIVTYCDIMDERDSGLTVWTYTEITDEVELYQISVSGGINDQEFSLVKTTGKDGKLLEYQCQRYFAEGDLYMRSVSYISDTDVFCLTTIFRDGGQNDSEIPGADYVHGAWEDPSEYL